MEDSEITKHLNLEQRRELAQKFINPYCDASDPAFSEDEFEIIDRMRSGEELSQDRHYLENIDSYVVGWVWMTFPKYPRQWDGPVEHLITRGVIRSSQCGGGYTWMIFTERAREVFKLDPSEHEPAPYTGPGSWVDLERFRNLDRRPRRHKQKARTLTVKGS